MQPVTRQAHVQLGADTVADATLGVGVLTEAVTVTAATSIDRARLRHDQERRVERADRGAAGRRRNTATCSS